MGEIISRLDGIDVILLGNEFVFSTEIEKWPIVDFFICLGQKKGFPLHKARDYCTLVNPVILNDLDFLAVLRDRSEIHRVLVDNKISVPRTLLCKGSEDDVIQVDDLLQVGGKSMMKPFVEKPFDSTDHNVFIYYPGGGCRKLFRKMKNQSSSYDPDVSEIRNGSILYQEFVQSNDNQDIKVYVVGEYVYAESRKAPTVDGIVERNENGKENRYAVELTGKIHDSVNM